MTREMVVQKMQQFLPESEKAVTTRSLISWEAGEREPRVTVGVALAKALGFEDVADLYLDSEPKLNPVGQQRLGEYRSMLLHTAEFTEKPEPTLRLLPVYLQPASAGTGVIAGGPVRAVLECAGIKDIRAKSLRSNNPINVTAATFAGLCGLTDAESVAAKRGKTVAEILG